MKSQQQIVGDLVGVGVAKTAYPPMQKFVRTLMAGAFIALGGILSVVASAGFADNPSAQKIVSGLAFPIGLLLTVVFGAELFTGNCAVLMPGAIRGRLSVGQVIGNLAAVWAGNFVGALAVVALMVMGSGLLDAAPFSSVIVKMADMKVSLDPMTAFWRGIGCNWLVCLAIWLALTSDSLVGKAVGCWIPVVAFVILGLEHSVANMFFIPAGMYVSGCWDFAALVGNLLPVTLGNIVGGSLFVGCLATWLYRPKE